MIPESRSVTVTTETRKRVFRVDRREIGYLRYTVESYDGMATVTTRDPYAALIELAISPGCEEMVMDLLSSLRKDEGLAIEPLPVLEHTRA